MALERNETRPSIASLERLCEALSASPDTFFTASDDDEADLRPTELGRNADEWIARTLATAPPLTKRQAERISAALFGRAS
jgi:transcriptional regulator with XRE-family HTH domain